MKSDYEVLHQEDGMGTPYDQVNEEAYDEIQRESVLVDNDPDPPIFSFKKLWAFTGPGFLMSIAYLDPGNIESDLQAGAVGGYSLLWVLFWATVMGLLLQLLAARLGVVCGKHLAEVCRENYSPVPRYLLWIMTELAIVGSDIQEVVGSAIAINILSDNYIPLWVGCLITAADTFSFLFLEKYGIRKLEAFFGLLVSIMAISFGVEYFISEPDELQVIKGVVIPYVPSDSVTQAVGIVGAVIMPHNIFLHSALVQSRRIDRTKPVNINEANKYNAIESSIALGVSFFINLFVVSVFAAGFSTAATSSCDYSASDIGLAEAGDYLACRFHEPAKYIWAVGLLAAGQSSTMTGTYAGQFVMQGFLNLKIAPWKRVLLTRSVAIVPAVLVAALAGDYLDALDEGLNVLQSVQLPFALIPILKFTSKESLMHQWKNNLLMKIICWSLAIVVLFINFYQIVYGILNTFGFEWWVITIFTIGTILYLGFVLYLTIYDLRFFVNMMARLSNNSKVVNIA